MLSIECFFFWALNIFYLNDFVFIVRIHIFWNRKAISISVQCLHSQLHVIRSFDIRFFSFASNFHVNMDTNYDMDNTWELHMQQSTFGFIHDQHNSIGILYSVFCQLSLKCKCWTIEAFVCSLFRMILFCSSLCYDVCSMAKALYITYTVYGCMPPFIAI